MRVIIFFLFIVSCTQKPASISYNGNIFYGKDKPVSIANKSIFKKKKAAKPSLKTGEVRIEPGDNLYVIAKKNKTSVRELIELNDLEPPYILHPGKALKIPTVRKTHIVTNGDNLTFIARTYNTTITKLTNINNIERAHKLQIGEILILPYEASSENLPTNTSKIAKFQKKILPKISQNNVSFVWPVKGKIISKFGSKKEGVSNDGINISAPLDTSVKAAREGKVVYVGSELRGYGNLIIIKHSNNWLTAYAHNNNIYVAKNQEVETGETIATVGQTGNVAVPQLHFGLRQGKKAVDPRKYLK